MYSGMLIMQFINMKGWNSKAVWAVVKLGRPTGKEVHILKFISDTIPY